MFGVCVCVCVCARARFSVFVYRKRPCDELITRPRSSTECLRLVNRSEKESFMEVGQGRNWGCSIKGKATFATIQSKNVKIGI
jgi:hypothetical protein